jgi:hypothetical protein
MQPVHFRNPGGQRFQLRALDDKQLFGNRTDMFFISAIDPIAPCPRLTVQIVPIGEGSPGQKVSLDKMKRTGGVSRQAAYNSPASRLLNLCAAIAAAICLQCSTLARAIGTRYFIAT